MKKIYLLISHLKEDTRPANLNLTATKYTKKYFTASKSLTTRTNIYKEKKKKKKKIFITH